jgi:DNA-binding MarR family transcriptional regulator
MQDSAKSNRTLFELDLLRALVMVADCGSFTTAATRLHSTQSTVSQKVRRLEELAGHRLLERGHIATCTPPMPATPCSATRGACST